MASYFDCISDQSKRNPCVMNLKNFLTENHCHPCRIKSLKFFQAVATPEPGEIRDHEELRRDIENGNLVDNIGNSTGTEGGTENVKARPKDLLGQIFIIEDLKKDIIETLGSILNIDPLFFASHLDTISMDINSQAPDKATLPSRMRPKKYVNIHYHRSIVFDGEEKPPESVSKLLRPTNIHRKVTVLPPIKNTRIGLSQHCVSIYKIKRERGDWLALILTDPRMGNMYQKHPKPLSSSLFAGGYEDFLDPPRTSNTRTVKPDRDSLLEDLMYYWNIDESHNFDARDPSLVSISRYPLQIAAREWINYVAVMSHSVKQYEYDSNDFRDFVRVHVDLKELQRWRRRTMASQQKMRAVTTFLRCAQAFERKKDRLQWNLILADYEYISENIESCGRLLENMVPVVQILDSRRSFAETATTTRLTTMALIFFPLGLFASMFSMTDRFAPGKSLFWVYFVVAVPICAVVYFLARPRPWMLRVWNSFHIGKARGDAGNSAV